MFGISGDLSRRYVLPALSKLAKEDLLPKDFRLLGLTRNNSLDLKSLFPQDADNDLLLSKSSIFGMDITKEEEYQRLSVCLDNLSKDFTENPDYVFYLALPPDLVQKVTEMLLVVKNKQKNNIKILLEKPFGSNLENALLLKKNLENKFNKGDIYLADHFLAKKIVRTVVPFRLNIHDFEKYWNKDYIEKIEISISEKIDIQQRTHFYENTGAIGDCFQNHLLEMLSLVLLDLPSLRTMPISDSRLDVLNKLKIKNILLGQYIGYRKEVNNESSQTETFIKAQLFSEDPMWSGVPMILETGKALNQKFTKISINFKKHKEFEGGVLVFDIYPNSKIMWNGKEVIVPNTENTVMLDSYEFVFYAMLRNMSEIFVSLDESIACWKILDYAKDLIYLSKDQLFFYEKNTDIKQINSLTLD